MPEKNVNKPKKQKVKQGHKLVWLTLLVIAIPCCFVGYVLLTSMEEQGSPVIGERFSSKDISPAITNTAVSTIEQEVKNIAGVEDANVDLKSATLRINLNMEDGISESQAQSAVEEAYQIVNAILPIETYFTNSDDGKMYDLEIGAYNFLVDDSHPASEQVYVKLTKTGRGSKVIDILTTPKDAQLASEVLRQTVSDEEQSEEEEIPEEEYYDYDYYYD